MDICMSLCIYMYTKALMFIYIYINSLEQIMRALYILLQKTKRKEEIFC